MLRQILLDHAHVRLILLVALHSRRMDTWDSPPLFSHWGKEPSPDHAASSIARRPIRSSLSCSCLSTCSSALLAAHAPIKPNLRASATCPRPQQGPSGIGREAGVGPDARKEHQAQLLATHGLAPWTFGGSRGVRVIKLCVNQTFAFTPDDRKLLHNSLTTGSAFRLGQENSLFSFRSPVSLPVDSGLAVSPRQENRFRGWKGFRARVGNRSMGHVCVKSACGPKLTD